MESEGSATAVLELSHEDEFVRNLFDRMGPSYAVMNVVSSFGFSEFWRWQCVRNAGVQEGSTVCDMMAGSGECWKHLPRNLSRIIGVDFSDFMCERQRRRQEQMQRPIDIRCGNATSTNLDDGSVQHVISAFGLKTLSDQALVEFAGEVARVLQPGGTFSILEISVPPSRLLRKAFMGYIGLVIPLLGRVCLGGIDCYRYLGEYTQAFGDVSAAREHFEEAGLEVEKRNHFFGCATSLVGRKPPHA